MLALEVEGRTVAVVGAGRVGMRKARKLAAHGARLRIIDPAASPWPDHEVRARPYQLGDLDGCDLALACTGNRDVDEMVASEARSRHIPCNRADGTGDVDMVATTHRGDMMLGVHAGGDPRRAVALRDQLQARWSDLEARLPSAPGTEQLAGLRSERPAFVLSGFGPFPGVGDNPTPAIAEEAASRLPWLDVHVVELPTVFGEAWPILEAELTRVGPRLAAVFALGVAVRRRNLDIETVAFNRRTMARPDARGLRAPTIAIRAGEAPERRVKFDAERAAERLRADGHPARTSSSAGDYLCNETFYELLAWQHRTGFRGPAGFIHVPALSSLSLGPSAEAIAALVSLASTGMPETSLV